jgi:transcriptional regulator with GAF, ATPase, and Fis domain
MDNQYSVAHRYHPQNVLDDFRSLLCGVLGAQRAGLARLTTDGNRFENIAVWDLHEGTSSWEPFFQKGGTAASWVIESECPIAGESITAMNPFPSTQAYLVRHEFASNLLVPLALKRFGSGVLYLLSRKTGTFSMSTIPAGQRVRDVLEPALRTYFAALELQDGADDESPARHRVTDELDTGMLTLDQVQRRHIEDVLTRTNWVIDGPVGAARLLDMRPSTLRNRMHKLSIRRPSRQSGSSDASCPE